MILLRITYLPHFYKAGWDLAKEAYMHPPGRGGVQQGWNFMKWLQRMPSESTWIQRNQSLSTHRLCKNRTRWQQTLLSMVPNLFGALSGVTSSKTEQRCSYFLPNYAGNFSRWQIREQSEKEQRWLKKQCFCQGEKGVRERSYWHNNSYQAYQ